ncbi:Zinc finger BED domain-containing protein RICESLEEPER 1 [Bienertia sinuspersici]
MERLYHPKFYPYAPESKPTMGTKNKELDTIGSTTPSTPVSGKVEMRATVWEHYSFIKLSDVNGEYRLIVSIVITPIVRVFVFMFAKAIMYHSYALCMVEQVLSYLNTKVRQVTRNTILRVCFTCDCWSTCTTRGFLNRITHFIDSNWPLKSRILNFRYFPLPHRGERGLKSKALSITCDNVGVMDVMVARLKLELLSFCTLPIAGHYFNVHCSAHILNLIVQSRMKVIDNNVLELREAVNYKAGSDACLCTFEKCVLDFKCKFVRKLRLDFPTRLNSTYLMLNRALESKDTLVLFVIVDCTFDFSLFSEEWTIVEFVCRFLAPFHSIIEFLGNNYEVVALKKLASIMLEKLEKYWGDYPMLLAIAIALDL